MTTQLTEAGQKLTDELVRAGVLTGYLPDSRVAKLNTAAQILLTPEGGGMRDSVGRPAYVPDDLTGPSRLEWMVGFYSLHVPAGVCDRLLDLAHEWRAALAPKTSAPGSDAGMREALAWYGEQARLARLLHSEGDKGRHALAGDGGKRAAAALSAFDVRKQAPAKIGEATYQYREIGEGDGWQDCSKETYESYQRDPHIDTRTVPALAPPTGSAGDDIERCFACDVAFKPGDMVIQDVTEGTMHRDCAGPERESYVGADGEPLKDGDPIPTGYPWRPDFEAGPAGDDETGVREAALEKWWNTSGIERHDAKTAFRAAWALAPQPPKAETREQIADRFMTALPDLTREDALCAAENAYPECLRVQPPKAETPAGVELRIVFDGPPNHDGPRFVEVEDVNGNSVRAGEWHDRPDGLCELRLSTQFAPAARAGDEVERWVPIERFPPRTKALFGRWTMYGIAGQSDEHWNWEEATGTYHDYEGERFWNLDGRNFSSSPFYGKAPTHAWALPTVPAGRPTLTAAPAANGEGA